jgi:predicted patatin/cPLA2 family phospholipase
MAGGGAKIGWASGALQVLIDEADLKFDHIDATSGSVFNLGMLLSGRSGTHIADAWANLSPKEFVSFHPWWKYLTFWRLPSLLTQDAAVKRILPKWGIDLEKIRTCRQVNGHPVKATFNVVDFGTKRVKTISHTRMDLDYFLAIDAVPGVVPPVAKDGTLYIDAMLLKDANLTEAVRQGADEIWVIWTVEDRLEWRGGFWNHFGHIFETCAIGNLKRELDEIEEVNRRVHEGSARPDQRHVTVHLIRPEEPIPVDYLFFKSKEQMRPVIEAGRAFARRYLAARGYLAPAASAAVTKGVRFTETMSGYFTPGSTDYRAGYERGREDGHELEFTLTISVTDLERFIAEPSHEAGAAGVVRSPFFGGVCPVTRGIFNLFRKGPGNVRYMDYELEFKTAQDRRYLLKGQKTVRDDPGHDVWSDTTTLLVDVLEAEGSQRVGAGILRISVPQFLRQLTTFEALGAASAAESLELLACFGKFFMGALWDTYGPGYFRPQGAAGPGVRP